MSGLKKWHKVLYIGFFAVLLYGITVWDMISQDRFFSETENRILAEKPKPDYQSVLAGSWESDYETYLTDQFVERDKWIGCKTYSEKLMGKKDINGVYLAKDNYLIERHLEADIDKEKAEQKLMRLEKDVQDWQELVEARSGRVKVMLIPTAAQILEDKLPAFAEDFDQTAYLDRLDGRLSSRIRVEDKLLAHKEEAIYYRTDHHWTTLGAYYGYRAWAESMGTEAWPLSSFEKERVSKNFLGTLHSKLNISINPDEITLFVPKEKIDYSIWYDLEEKPHTSLYENSHLDTKNQYGIFLDDNHALVRIENESAPQRSILVIKDSYANCFVPFLSIHYNQIYMIDKRYYRGKINAFLEENKVEDVLILYDVIHFIENY